VERGPAARLTAVQAESQVSIIFGAKATEAVLAADDVPDHVKTALREARQYVEGRGLRLPVGTVADVGLIERLAALKLDPT